jgi:hypothetical protein
MRAACRNHRCHHAKPHFKPFPATETVGSSDRVEYRRYCHDDDGVIQPDIPSSVYFPDVLCGSSAPRIGTAYTSWLIGAKEESKDPESLASSSVVTEEAEGSGLNSRMVASPGIATCGGLDLVEDRCSAASRDRAARHDPELLPHFKVLTVCWLRSALREPRRQQRLRLSLHDFVFARSDFKPFGEPTLSRSAEHDPEKHALGPRPDGWVPVFRKDHAQTKR